MKDKIIKAILSPVLSIFITLIFFIFLIFFKSDTYTSQSKISLKNDSGNALSFLQNPLLGGLNVNSNIDELRGYLISDQSLYVLKDSIEMKEFFGIDKADFFSAYTPGALTDRNFKKYLLNKIDIGVDNSSGNLVITTKAFTPEDSFILNLKNIELANNFLTAKQNQSSQISRINSICRLAVTQSNFSDISISSDPTNNLTTEIEDASANDLLLRIAENNAKKCEEIFSGTKDNINTENIDKIGSSFITEIRSSSIKDILKQYYNNSVLSLTSSDQISIVSEPQIPIIKDDKNIILNSVLLLFGLMLTQLSISTIRKLYDEFN